MSLDERQKIVECVRRWGGSASDAVLDTTCQIFKLPHIDGLIGYRTENSCVIVYGDPVCARANISALTQAFYRFCEEQGKHIIFVSASEYFSNWAAQHICPASVEFGEELILNPQQDPSAGAKGSLVRRKVRHALHEGTSVNEYIPSDVALEQAIEEVGNIWLKSRRGPQMYTSHIRLFDDRSGKRWFYAKKDNLVVGAVVLNRIQAREGWHFNHLMFTPQASHGTPELLIMTAVETLQKEGCQFATFGTVSSKNLGKINGFGCYASLFARTIYKIVSVLFHLNGKKMFWGKFQPQGEPSYLLFSRPSVGMKELLGIMKAMNVSI